MSLKAKIEAVIYASEEPVTLVQLIGLLGQEAQAELLAADARQGQLDLMAAETVVVVQEVESGDPDALNAETLGIEVFAPVAGADDQVLDEGSTQDRDHPGNAGAEPEAEALGSTDVDAATESEALEARPEAAAPEANAENTEVPETSSSDDPQPNAETTEDETEGEAVAGFDQLNVDQSGAELSPAEVRARERRLREYVRSILEELVADYRDSDRGLEVREVAGGYRFATKPEYHDAVRGFVRSLKPPLKLSLQALETLAVVAYKQPVTAPEVSEVRGVDSAGALGSLVGRKLVATAGRKQVIGRPILYKTTKEFLLRFGLKDLNELPSIEEFERLASEVNEAVQEEIPMAETLDQMKPAGVVGDAARNVEPMRDVHAAQPDGIPDELPNQQGDAERTTAEPDGPGEFTGDETVPPADNANIDGRMSGVPPTYDEPEAGVDSPALDAEVQGEEQLENGGSDD